MARYTGADCRRCRREKMKLFLKGSKCEGPKCPFESRPFPPGQHGRGRTKETEYLLQLREKQKARRVPGGMRPFTSTTLTSPEAFEADLTAGDRRGMQIEIGQFRSGVACAAVLVAPDRDVERRAVIACALPAAEMMTSARMVRARLLATARGLAEVFAADNSGG